MAFGSDSFENFMGYRFVRLEEAIDECIAQIRNGETEITVSARDLTAEELEYVKQEVHRRLG